MQASWFLLRFSSCMEKIFHLNIIVVKYINTKSKKKGNKIAKGFMSLQFSFPKHQSHPLVEVVNPLCGQRRSHQPQGGSNNNQITQRCRFLVTRKTKIAISDLPQIPRCCCQRRSEALLPLPDRSQSFCLLCLDTCTHAKKRRHTT